MVAREATFLLSVATEEFIKRIAEESNIIAARENRITVQYRDMGRRYTLSMLSTADVSPV